MPSPFPGMNPYLEQDDAWHDFHESFLPRARDLLNQQVGENYLVKIDEHIYVHQLTEEARVFVGRSDVMVSSRSTPGDRSSQAGVLEAPVQVHLRTVDLYRESFLEIRDRRGRSLITVIELLSPANKAGRDREQYLRKRDEVLASEAHLVEIDLLRGGHRMPFDDLPPCDYYAMVSRVESRPAAGLWPITLRNRLPVIPIPLKAPDRDVELDLQQLLHDVYDAAGYAKYIYEGDPSPPLSPDDAAWARQVMETAARSD